MVMSPSPSLSSPGVDSSMFGESPAPSPVTMAVVADPVIESSPVVIVLF
jgi:hypothetical protein